MRKSRLALVGVLALTAASTALPSYAAGTDAVITTRLVGAQEVPGPGDENGKGDFAATLTRNTMCYSFWARRIDSPTMAHIHAAPRGVAGDVVITLLLPDKHGVQACMRAVPDDQDTPVTMSESELALLKNTPEAMYVNVHNEEFPPGAVRGQLKDGRD